MSQKLQLYSLATPNGQKVAIALEEMDLEYEAHRIDIMKDEQFTPEFIKINPNSKIPALVDPVGDEGKPLPIMESGAILVYLAQMSGLFLGKKPVDQNRVLQWLFFQMGGVGPMFGQFGHFFKYGKDNCDHPYPVSRYAKETRRLLGVIEAQLAQKPFIAGQEISIADFSIFPWVLALSKFYEAEEFLKLNEFEKTARWADQIADRPAVQKGLKVCAF